MIVAVIKVAVAVAVVVVPVDVVAEVLVVGVVAAVVGEGSATSCSQNVPSYPSQHEQVIVFSPAAHLPWLLHFASFSPGYR